MTLSQVISCGVCEISKNNFSYRTPPVAAFCMLIIHVKQNFSLRRKTFLETREKLKENIYKIITTNFLWENKIIQFLGYDYVYVNKYLYDCFCRSEKKYIWNWSKMVFFTFFINFFVETLIKSTNYCQTVPLDHLLLYILNSVCQASVLSLWVNLVILCLDYCQMGIFRGIRPEVFCKKGVLRNFAKFTGKHLCQRWILRNF